MSFDKHTVDMITNTGVYEKDGHQAIKPTTSGPTDYQTHDD